MKTPNTIHHTWKDENIPLHLQAYVESWKIHHPTWQFKLWTDKMNHDFIELNFPGFLPIYDSYPNPIQRVDAVRYFILSKEGGVFVDLDFECLKNIEDLLNDTGFLVGMEPPEHAKRHKKPYILSNAFMAATPNHPFLLELCALLHLNQYRKHKGAPGFNDILDCAGPFMLSRAYESYEKKEQVQVVDHDFLFPLVKDYFTGNVDINELDKSSKAFAVHHYWGSWWKGA